MDISLRHGVFPVIIMDEGGCGMTAFNAKLKSKSVFFLGDLAYARSGDKGNGANVALFARTAKGYEFLKKHFTASRVQKYFKPLGVGKVTRYEVPNLEAFNFVLPNILAGGGSRSLRIDAQGKTLGQALLEMTLKRSR